jgi:nicotinate-nucleotide adenylyltransferase
MRIGLFFGSFNPVHVGHLIIANHILNEGLVDRLWFVVSPQNPFKESNSLLNEFDRLHLVRIAVEDDARMKASDIEFHLPRPSYTIATLTYLQEKYPDDEFFIVMGSDGFQNLGKWKNAEAIIKNYGIIIYNRPGFPVLNDLHAKLQTVDAPLLDISATEIRSLIKNKKSVRYLIPEKVREEIERSNYFRK